MAINLGRDGPRFDGVRVQPGCARSCGSPSRGEQAQPAAKSPGAASALESQGRCPHGSHYLTAPAKTRLGAGHPQPHGWVAPASTGGQSLVGTERARGAGALGANASKVDSARGTGGAFKRQRMEGVARAGVAAARVCRGQRVASSEAWRGPTGGGLRAGAATEVG